ncbi:MAG TPA: chemotaxis protein CheW [Gemmatimonadaceae bacterium]|nr:chemotaxis protein CheW [Gemmatimonadaceae bacterium]
MLFRLGDRRYGIDLDAVREILPVRRTTRVPGAPAYVAGLINVRGTIVTVLDLGARLDGNSSLAPDGSVILVEHRQKVVGIAVAEVNDVMMIPAESIEQATERDEVDAAIVGLGRMDDKVVIILDIHSIIKHVLL